VESRGEGRLVRFYATSDFVPNGDRSGELNDTAQATAGRQEPYTYGSLPGREDFFFVQR